MKRVAVLQSGYIPWKGYFDIVHDVDLFVFYDDVQFTKQDWRSRNRIKTAGGPIWLTVPTGADQNRRICEVRLQDASWQARHWKSIRQAYSRAPHFDRYAAFFEHAYLGMRWETLSELNRYLTEAIARDFLGIRAAFADSRGFAAAGQKQDRLLDLLVKAGAETYVSGPAARSYIDEARFREQGIALVWKSYEGYPEYPQRHPPFEHAVSVIDLLFNAGPEAPRYIWGWRCAD